MGSLIAMFADRFGARDTVRPSEAAIEGLHAKAGQLLADGLG